MAKKLILGLILTSLCSQFFFRGFHLYWMLDMVASYHCMQFHGKLLNKTWENGTKPSFGPDFGPSDPNSGRKKIFFSKIWLRQSLDIIVSYHHVQYQKKLTIKSWENLVTDGQTDGQTEEADFIGHSPTNVKPPIGKVSRQKMTSKKIVPKQKMMK